ncbi:hypothetical protein ASPVEDRAFT_36285 [Aspergillus versicolor CBS 583.65]|uniref:Uncharacterized protein n=1 Tax=Aspergillus versicolor CBS 583.65 TaxID=1036611 RepID=A0A1L9P5X9_ASPVE|nr:uncharacterized protein ASPVEDRAFT_36285 [Aspergillus versicolor CBS 583.65]OJI96892.1 hypothetical protein ASPVEDRAFT_36285 [Aspergillus versicolor CBS 583.65]
MKSSFVILSLSFILPSVFAECETNQKYCGEYLESNQGYNRADIISAAQANTGLPSEARNEYRDDWMEVIFHCVDGEEIAALEFCTDGEVCKENNGGTGAECKVDFPLID